MFHHHVMSEADDGHRGLENIGQQSLVGFHHRVMRRHHRKLAGLDRYQEG